jgi:hypothetical protein
VRWLAVGLALVLAALAGCATVPDDAASVRDKQLKFQKQAIDRLYGVGEKLFDDNEALQRENNRLQDLITSGFVCT